MWNDEQVKALGIGRNFEGRARSTLDAFQAADGWRGKCEEQQRFHEDAAGKESQRANVLKCFMAVQVAALRKDYPETRGAAKESETGWHHFVVEYLKVSPAKAKRMVRVGNWIEQAFPSRYAKLLSLEFEAHAADREPQIPEPLQAPYMFAPLHEMSQTQCLQKAAQREERIAQEQDQPQDKGTQGGLGLPPPAPDPDVPAWLDEAVAEAQQPVEPPIPWQVIVTVQNLHMMEDDSEGPPEGLRDALESAVGEAVLDLMTGRDHAGIHLDIQVSAAPKR